MTRSKWIDRTVDIIETEGGMPGSNFHSWRCEDKERYPEPCTCVREVAADIVNAIEPMIRADELYDGTSAKVWARLAMEANAACITAMNERDSARAESGALCADLTMLRDDNTELRAALSDMQESIARDIEERAREQWTLGTDWVTISARIARGES